MKTFEKGIEKLFFKKQETKRSKWLSYMIINVILMVGVFYILLNIIIYNFTGSLYPLGSGFRLNFLGDDYSFHSPNGDFLHLFILFNGYCLNDLFCGY